MKNHPGVGEKTYGIFPLHAGLILNVLEKRAEREILDRQGNPGFKEDPRI